MPMAYAWFESIGILRPTPACPELSRAAVQNVWLTVYVIFPRLESSLKGTGASLGNSEPMGNVRDGPASMLIQGQYKTLYTS